MDERKLKRIVHEELMACFRETTGKERTMKRSELKGLIKEVVRQCIKEGGPQYKVLTGKTQVNDPSDVRARDRVNSDPEINEDFPADAQPAEDEAHGEYDEQDEIRLIKAMGQAIVKLLQMHKGMDQEEEEETPEEAPPEEDAPTDDEPPVNENHKVQHRSHRTVDDQVNNPQNMRDPEVPLG